MQVKPNPAGPQRTPPGTKPKRHHKARKSIRLDKLHPAEFLNMNLIFACEHCSHYSPSLNQCTMGYKAQHTLAVQLELYQRTGAMAFCRFLEID